MSILTFGEELLRTGDLDPVYSAIYAARLDRPKRLRLALAYWCFYHLGLAAKIAEQPTTARYWALFEKAVLNEGEPKTYPRGAERRHFRGGQALSAYKALRARYKTPEQAAEGLIGPLHTFAAVAKSVQSHERFGPWMSFKIADMAERVLDVHVDFTNCELGIYKDPRQGAAVAFLEIGTNRAMWPGDPWLYPITDKELKLTVEHYVKAFRKFKAPPTGDRPVNVQEVETVFCKGKSNLKGHYPMGKDTREIGHGLDGWGDLAQQLKKGLPCLPA